MEMKKLWMCLIALGAVSLFAQSATAQQWRWQLDPPRYAKMSVFERGQYDKSAKLFETGDFLAAASEFEKFKAQYPDSSNISYILFMQGLSQHSAKNRNKAIKIYNEVLDYFGDSIADAAPALYYLGQAQFENGETTSGMKSFQEMADDEDYRNHPLAAGAIRTLADNYFNNTDDASALKYWKQVVRDFETTNGEETRKARNQLVWYYIGKRDYVGMDDALIKYESSTLNQAERAETPAFRRAIYDIIDDIAWHAFPGNWANRYGATNTDNQKRSEDMAAYYKYLEATKPWWEKANDPWGYYEHTIRFLCYRWGDKESKEKQTTDATEWLKTLPDKAQADARLSRLCEMLRDARTYDRARYCLSLMTDRIAAAYREYEILAHEGKWTEALAQLQAVEAGGNVEWATRALGERARVYKDVLAQFDNAIKLYQQMNNPPHNLWAIQECYKRWGNMDQAISTLNEIENSFPDQASRAAFQKGAYYNEAGDDKRAIAAWKRLLQLYPKAPESSPAENLLEQKGVDLRGGGVGDTD